MKNNSMHKMLSLIGYIVLIAALALFTTGCSDKEPAAGTEATFTFVVVDLDGAETSFEVTTDAATVGDALLAEGLIEGEDGEYGLYVTTVNGITADWDNDQTYWAFYVNDEYATTGIDTTEIADDTVYSFVLTKG